MNRIQISGMIPLNGSVTVQGSKNAALPIMAASVLHEGITILRNCPKIQDVIYMATILQKLGCRIEWEKNQLLIDATQITSVEVVQEEAAKIRASVLLMGSLLGRMHQVDLPCPGGCRIGARPIDFHLQALERLGATCITANRMFFLRAKKIVGNEIVLPFPSVGATENAILTAVLAQGTTVIQNSAREPEIVELCRFLNEKGAKICGVGGKTLTIHGVSALKDSSYTLMSDRIVTGTYLLAAAGTYGTVGLKGATLNTLDALKKILIKHEVLLWQDEEGIWIDARNMTPLYETVCTAPYPGFPTDLQSPFMAVLCGTDSDAEIKEQIFESRFLTVAELKKMGADIRISGCSARIRGIRGALLGAHLNVHDLRGGAALVLAGLMAKGDTWIEESGLIARGYEDICRDLSLLGAKIRKTDSLS